MVTQTWTERAIACVVAEQHTVASSLAESRANGWTAAIVVLRETWDALERIETYLVGRLSR